MSNNAILLVGRDKALLQTRNLVLVSVGYRTVVTRDADFQEALTEHEPWAVVFCHSMPVECRDRLLMLMREVRPKAKALVLLELLSRYSSVPDVVYMDALAGPRALIEKLQDMAGDCADPSTGQ